MSFHKDLGNVDMHRVGHAAAADPGAIGAHKAWVDTGAGGVLMKVRNGTNTAWIVVGGLRVKTETGSAYTLQLSDDGNLIRASDGSGVTLTVPEDASVNFPVGARMMIEQASTGKVTIVGDGSASVRSEGDKFRTVGVAAVAELVKIGTNDWVLFGNLEDDYA